MKSRLILITILTLCINSIISFPQQQPQISFEDLMISAELDHRNVIEARKAALNLGVPVNIYFEEGIFIDAKGIENEQPVYAVIKNIFHPSENSEVMFYDEISTSFNLENARINYGNGIIVNPDVGKPEIENNQLSNRFVQHLLVAESGNNSVILLDFATGDLTDTAFIPPQNNLSLPKQARHSPRATISISDQTEDVVFDYDSSGSLIGIFAPSIGPHTAILDNIRGHNYRPGNNNLVVCNAQGGNFNRVVEFDTMGNYLGHFISDNSGGLLNPFDIIFRSNDVLLTGAISGTAHRYDLDGNYLDDFVTGLLFPQQMVEFPNGNIGIVNFGSSGALNIYDSAGIFLNTFSPVTWMRGVHYLGSGNIIVTNSAGVYEIDGNTGNLIRTIISGVDAQYVSACDMNLEVTPVELSGFSASISGNSVNLFWVTSSELNNYGFEVQRLQADTKTHEWKMIGFIEGNGTSSELNYYSFEDKNLFNGNYLYRLKQIDLDGSLSYSDVVEAEIYNPGSIVLFQNFPNPFNPSTTIEYYMPADGYVSIKLYNSIGEEISELVKDFRNAGRHSVIFSDDNLPSGLYFYSFISGSFIETRKMVLMK